MSAPTYANAAPPPGALFDNAPTGIPRLVDVPGSDGDVAIEFDTPADREEFLRRVAASRLTPATRICRDRGGRWIGVDVFMQYEKPIPLDLALRRVAIGRTVFVAREDAGAVLRAANGETTAV